MIYMFMSQVIYMFMSQVIYMFMSQLIILVKILKPNPTFTQTSS